MKARDREQFDELFAQVLEGLPEHLHTLIEEVPIIVEDYPSAVVMRELDIDGRSSLCGLHDGIPLTERSVEHSATMPTTISIYRQGILSLARDWQGRVDPDELERQIRITVLHEIGHYFGLDEDDLAALGYG